MCAKRATVYASHTHAEKNRLSNSGCDKNEGLLKGTACGSGLSGEQGPTYGGGGKYKFEYTAAVMH